MILPTGKYPPRPLVHNYVPGKLYLQNFRCCKMFFWSSWPIRRGEFKCQCAAQQEAKSP